MSIQVNIANIYVLNKYKTFQFTKSKKPKRKKKTQIEIKVCDIRIRLSNLSQFKLNVERYWKGFSISKPIIVVK